MFKKKPSIKSLTQLRSSDRRKLADQIIADFNLQARIDRAAHKLSKIPPLDDGSPDSGITPAAPGQQDPHVTAAIVLLRNLLLPEGTQAGRFSTTTGPDLRLVTGTVYIGPSGASRATRVLWVRIEDKIFPTVYTLWKIPRLTPLIHTPEVVVRKIKAGASLMTPGLSDVPPFPARATRGAIVAIASLERPSIPIAVGTCAIDIASLTDVVGAKGHAVDPVHWFEDGLWSWSPDRPDGDAEPIQLLEWLDMDEHDYSRQPAQQNNDSNDDGAQEDDDTVLVSVERDEGELVNAINEQFEIVKLDNVQSIDTDNSDVAESTAPTWAQKDVDRAFRDAFLYGLRQHLRMKPDHRSYGLELPLSQSVVMAGLVQPNLPIFGQSDAESLTIKKTSWKSVKRFIKHLAKDKIVKVKDHGNNEVVIIDINFGHVDVVNFRPLHKIPKGKKAAPAAASREEAGNDASLAQSVFGELPVGSSASASASAPGPVELQTISTYYRPKQTFSCIFPTELGVFLTRGDLQNWLYQYISIFKLSNPGNQGEVLIDSSLAKLYRTEADLPTTGFARRAALVDLAVSAHVSAPYWMMHSPDLKATDAVKEKGAKPKAGPAPKLTVLLETRTGNKSVSRLTGLEPFGIRPGGLADELRRACAASTSVERAAGVKKGVEAWEVMVQGQRSAQVMEVLAKLGVRPEWVDIVDKTKKKKR